MPISAVFSTNKRGAMVSLKSSDGILRELGRRVDDVVSRFFQFGYAEAEWPEWTELNEFDESDESDARRFDVGATHLAASSRMRHWPPVPFVPFGKGSTKISRKTLPPRSTALSPSRDTRGAKESESEKKKKKKIDPLPSSRRLFL